MSETPKKPWGPTMDDYISRKTFVEQKRKLYCENCSRRKDSKGKTVYEIGDAPCRACGIGDVLDDLDDFPAADVRPVVRGGWEEHGEPNEYGKYELWYYSCTRCGAVGVPEFNFCPNCGADMREES